jgi:uncharacterized membrane protein
MEFAPLPVLDVGRKDAAIERIEKLSRSTAVRTVYNQWTQFEQFPKFMSGVRDVRQLDDTHVHWRAEIFGARA